jgi:hypothetical protein
VIGLLACATEEPLNIFRKRDGNELESLGHRQIHWRHLSLDGLQREILILIIPQVSRNSTCLLKKKLTFFCPVALYARLQKHFAHSNYTRAMNDTVF